MMWEYNPWEYNPPIVEIRQQTNGIDWGLLYCYYMYRTVKQVSSMTRWLDIRYEEREYQEFIKGLIINFSKVKSHCLR